MTVELSIQNRNIIQPTFTCDISFHGLAAAQHTDEELLALVYRIVNVATPVVNHDRMAGPFSIIMTRTIWDTIDFQCMGFEIAYMPLFPSGTSLSSELIVPIYYRPTVTDRKKCTILVDQEETTQIYLDSRSSVVAMTLDLGSIIPVAHGPFYITKGVAICDTAPPGGG